MQTGCKPSPVQRRSEKGNLKHNNTVAGAPEERRRQSCEHYVLPEEFTLPAARLIPPKCTSSQMCRSDTYVNCHYPHVVSMCPQVHACTPPPATLLWPLFHSSVIGHTSSHSRKPVDSLPTPSRMVVAERVRASGLGRVPTRLLGVPTRLLSVALSLASQEAVRPAKLVSGCARPHFLTKLADLRHRLRWGTSFSGAWPPRAQFFP